MTRPGRLSIALATALALVACTERPPTGGGAGLLRGDGSSRDTATTGTPDVMHLYGRVLVSGSGSIRTDTNPDAVPHTPVAGAAIVVRRNELVGGRATQRVVAQTRTDARGRWDVGRLAGGYFVVYATAPAGSGLQDAWELVPLRESAEVNVYLRPVERPAPPAPDTSRAWNLETRIAVLESFRGMRGDVDATWTQYTIEGAPIVFAVHASRGSVVLSQDARADGGTAERVQLTTLALVRAEGDALVAVEPDAARRVPGVYFLRGTCANRACERVF